MLAAVCETHQTYKCQL